MRRVTDADPIGLDELTRLSTGRFGDMVKGVVDLGRGIMLLDADMHADQEAELLAEGARRQDPRWRLSLPRLREIARAREVVVDWFVGSNQYGSTAESLQKSFDAYAVMARRQAHNSQLKTEN
jgi:hypothetical protein